MSGTAAAYSLADTWHLNNRVNLMLLDHLTEQQLAVAANPRARSVGDQLAHLHNVRIMWLEAQGVKGLSKLEKGKATKSGLKQALAASGKVMGEFLADAERAGKMKAAKRGVTAFCGYALAHEAHHRGQVILHLKNAGMPVDRTVAFGIWEWEKI